MSVAIIISGDIWKQYLIDVCWKDNKTRTYISQHLISFNRSIRFSVFLLQQWAVGWITQKWRREVWGFFLFFFSLKHIYYLRMS